MAQLPMGPHINDMTGGEVLDELINRLTLTNAIDFISQDRIDKLVSLLTEGNDHEESETNA